VGRREEIEGREKIGDSKVGRRQEGGER